MAIQDDFSIATNGDIRWTGTTATYSVLEFHRFLQDYADDAVAAGDDLMDISVETPSDRSTDNIFTLVDHSGSGGPTFNVTGTELEHLYDGSLAWGGGTGLTATNLAAGLVVVGSVPDGTELQIIQDHALLTSYWGATPTALNADADNNILMRLCVQVRSDDANINGRRLRVQARELGASGADTYAEFIVTCALGNNTAAIFTGDDLNAETAAATIATYDQFGNTEGLNLLDINGDTTDEEYYSQYTIGGGTVPATPTINDLYEWTKWRQRRGSAETIHGMNGALFRGITHSFAYDAEAGVGPVTNDAYSWGLKIDYDNEAVSTFQVGEVVVINGTDIGRILAVDDNGTTGSLIVSMESGTPLDNEQIVGQTSGTTADVNLAPVGQATGGGSAVLLAVDDDGTTGNLYIQLTKGTAPADNTILYEDGDVANTVTVNGAVTQRTISPEYIGTSTGTALIGAYGIGVDPADTAATDLFFDLTNTPITPPNNVTFTVNGLVSGEDRVLVGPESGGGLDRAQFALNTTLSGATETAVVVTTSIPSDTPSTGTIRIELDSGIYRRVPYTSYTGSTFTIASTDFSTDNATSTNNVFISYVDELASGTTASFTSVFLANRSLFVRVRDGDTTPIKTFEQIGTLTANGGSVTAIRATDA